MKYSCCVDQNDLTGFDSILVSPSSTMLISQNGNLASLKWVVSHLSWLAAVLPVSAWMHWGVNSGMPLPSCFSCCLSLQVITLEGWVEIMYYVMDAHSFYNFIYFILLIIVSIRFYECQQCKLRAHKNQVSDQHRYWRSKLLGISEIQLVGFHQESMAGSRTEVPAKLLSFTQKYK